MHYLLKCPFGGCTTPFCLYPGIIYHAFAPLHYSNQNTNEQEFKYFRLSAICRTERIHTENNETNDSAYFFY